jgi:hypothetical protein
LLLAVLAAAVELAVAAELADSELEQDCLL